jgi:hypothetical protein
MEEDTKNTTLREKKLMDEIESLKSQLATKEREKVETVETLHAMEINCISIGAKLETKIEEYEKLKKDFSVLEREMVYVEKKSAEKDQVFYER